MKLETFTDQILHDDLHKYDFIISFKFREVKAFGITRIQELVSLPIVYLEDI